MKMTETQLEQRAREPIAQCLMRQLIVPKVYFGAPWPDVSSTVDLLVIDRAGSGDVHVVQIKGSKKEARFQLPQVMQIEAHYHWIAFLLKQDSSKSWAYLKELYPQQGAGRVGVIEVVRISNEDPIANIFVKAERFPLHLYDKADEFTARNTADIEFR